MSRQYPIGVQSFPEIRNGGYVYVDKTEYVHELVTTGKYYFLGRPRRFGKSLLLSTIEEYFLGHRELFRGLAIDRMEHNWIEYPVLHLDLNAKKYSSLRDLEEIIGLHLEKWEKRYGEEVGRGSIETRFINVIQAAFNRTGQQVVVLIDEYDKPLLQNIFNEELQRACRDTLKAFYGVLKSMDRYLKFAMLTGVTKFGKVSVFSDLNNLNDISFWDKYNGICGITERELHVNFSKDIAAVANVLEMSDEDVFAEMKKNYDGYHFCDVLKEDVYNPFSVLNALSKKRFYSYWFETGTPTFLVELLKKADYPLQKLNEEITSADALQGIDLTFNDPIGIIYQSGYLTIKGFDREFSTFNLGFPNREVEEGFFRFLMPYYTNVQPSGAAFAIQSFIRDVRTGNVDGFLERLKGLYSDFPYENIQKLELHYQNVMYIVMTLMGFYVRTEYHTSRGRIDLVIDTPSYLYVMEFKLDGSAEDAIAQIKDRHYVDPFSITDKEIIKVGVNFSSETRSLDQWIIER